MKTFVCCVVLVAATVMAAPANKEKREDQEAAESVHYGYHSYHPGHHYREGHGGFQCGSYRFCAYR